jgi:hypothetical protein
MRPSWVRKKISEGKRKYVFTDEHRRNLAESQKGKEASSETRAKLSAQRKNEKHPNWKGDEVSYAGLHQWLYRNKMKSGKCERCGAEGYTEFANVSGDYLRDVNDFMEVCRSCHWRYDRGGRKP